MAHLLENKQIKMCSVSLRDYSKASLRSRPVKEGSNSNVENRAAEAARCKTGAFPLSVLRSPEELAKFQDKSHSRVKLNKATSLDDESNSSTSGESNSRPSSAMSGSSNEDHISNTSRDSLFTKVDVSQQQAPSRGKRAYSEISLDEDEVEFIPVKIKNDFEAIDAKDNVKDNEEEYIVEKIVDIKVQNGLKLYYVKWKDYTSEHNTWEPESHMSKCKEMILEFMREKTAKLKAPIGKKSRETVFKSYSKVSKKRDNTQNPSDGQTATEYEYSKNRKDETICIGTKAVQNHSDVVESSSFEDRLIASPEITVPETVIEVDKVHLLDSSVGGLFPGKLVYILRVWKNNKVQYLHLDVTKKHEKEMYYNLIITEDIKKRSPQWLFGASVAADGKAYCLVQFSGYQYIDLVTPQTLFKEFPYLSKFYNQLQYNKKMLVSASTIS